MFFGMENRWRRGTSVFASQSTRSGSVRLETRVSYRKENAKRLGNLHRHSLHGLVQLKSGSASPNFVFLAFVKHASVSDVNHWGQSCCGIRILWRRGPCEVSTVGSQVSFWVRLLGIKNRKNSQRCCLGTYITESVIMMMKNGTPLPVRVLPS